MIYKGLCCPRCGTNHIHISAMVDMVKIYDGTTVPNINFVFSCYMCLDQLRRPNTFVTKSGKYYKGEGINSIGGRLLSEIYGQWVEQEKMYQESLNLEDRSELYNQVMNLRKKYVVK